MSISLWIVNIRFTHLPEVSALIMTSDANVLGNYLMMSMSRSAAHLREQGLQGLQGGGPSAGWLLSSKGHICHLHFIIEVHALTGKSANVDVIKVYDGVLSTMLGQPSPGVVESPRTT